MHAFLSNPFLKFFLDLFILFCVYFAYMYVYHMMPGDLRSQKKSPATLEMKL